MKLMASMWVIIAARVCCAPAAELQASPPEETTSGLPVASQPPVSAAPSVYVSPWIGEVSRLVEARVDTPVVLEFINNAGSFGLTSSRIVGLHQDGIPGEIISAMIQHDAEYVNGLRGNPPAPPPKTIILRPIWRSPGERAAPAKPLAPPQDSIVNPSPALDAWLEYYHPDPAPVPVRGPSQGVARVREPIPVRLTSTILVHRGATRVPNNFTLEPFPSEASVVP